MKKIEEILNKDQRSCYLEIEKFLETNAQVGKIYMAIKEISTEIKFLSIEKYSDSVAKNLHDIYLKIANFILGDLSTVLEKTKLEPLQKDYIFPFNEDWSYYGYDICELSLIWVAYLINVDKNHMIDNCDVIENEFNEMSYKVYQCQEDYDFYKLGIYNNF